MKAVWVVIIFAIDFVFAWTPRIIDRPGRCFGMLFYDTGAAIRDTYHWIRDRVHPNPKYFVTKGWAKRKKLYELD